MSKYGTLNVPIQRNLNENHFSDLDILIISHEAVIRELIKYFVYDLRTDIGAHLDTIQELTTQYFNYTFSSDIFNQ